MVGKFNFDLIAEPVNKIYSNFYNPKAINDINELYHKIKLKLGKGTAELFFLTDTKGLYAEKETYFEFEHEFLIKVKDLVNIVNVFEGEVDIEVTDNSLFVRQGNRKLRTVIESSEYFVFFDDFKLTNNKLNVGDYYNVLKNYVAQGKYENVLGSIYFNSDANNAYGVATNRHIACLVEFDKQQFQLDNGILLDTNLIFEDAEYKLGTAGFKEQEENANWIFFQKEEAGYIERIFTLQILGEYPVKIVKVMKEELPYYLSINKQEVLDFISTLKKMYGNQVSFFALRLKDNKITLSGYNEIVPENKYEIELKDFDTNYDDLFIGFNIEYFKKFVLMPKDNLYITFNDSLYILREENYTTLIMPINLKRGE